MSVTENPITAVDMIKQEVESLLGREFTNKEYETLCAHAINHAKLVVIPTLKNISNK